MSSPYNGDEGKVFDQNSIQCNEDVAAAALLCQNTASKAKPKISVKHIYFSSRDDPTATVAWEFQPPPLTHLSRYSVRIFKKRKDTHEQWDHVHTEHIDQTENHCSFTVPELVNSDDGYEYEVTVEAECVDHDNVCSNRTAMGTSKGCCYGVCTTKICVCQVISCIMMAILLLCGTGALSLVVGIFAEDLGIVQANTSWIQEYQVFIVKLPFQPHSLLLEFDLSSLYVYKTQPDNTEMYLYCNDYPNSILNNNQRPRYLKLFRQENKILTNADRFLPLGSTVPSAVYALSQSNLSVSLCLSNKSNILPSVRLELHKRVDALSWEAHKNPVIASVDVLFGKDMCSNSSVVVPESAVVFLSLSTNDVNIHFDSINGTGKVLYYNSTSLGLWNESNRIDTKKNIPVSVDSKLLCYVTGGGELDVHNHAVLVSAQQVWNEDWLAGSLFAIFFLLFLSVVCIFCACVSYKYRQRECCTSCRKYQSYEEI